MGKLRVTVDSLEVFTGKPGRDEPTDHYTRGDTIGLSGAERDRLLAAGAVEDIDAERKRAQEDLDRRQAALDAQRAALDAEAKQVKADAKPAKG